MGKKKRSKAVLVSVEWWKLYSKDDDGNFTVREDGVSDGTIFYTLDAVEEYMFKVADFHDMRIKLYRDRNDPDVMWIDAIDRFDKSKRTEKIRKVVRSKKYLSAESIQSLIAHEHEHQELFESTAEVEELDLESDTEEPQTKKVRAE